MHIPPVYYKVTSTLLELQTKKFKSTRECHDDIWPPVLNSSVDLCGEFTDFPNIEVYVHCRLYTPMEYAQATENSNIEPNSWLKLKNEWLLG
jgi:hypothetical protein